MPPPSRPNALSWRPRYPATYPPSLVGSATRGPQLAIKTKPVGAYDDRSCQVVRRGRVFSVMSGKIDTIFFAMERILELARGEIAAHAAHRDSAAVTRLSRSSLRDDIALVNTRVTSMPQTAATSFPNGSRLSVRADC